MTVTTCSGLAHWEAAGVRHAILLRVLPVLSHDLATPITVLRMTSMVLRRKLAIEPVDAEYCVERLEALEQQTHMLGQTLKLLGGWEPGAAGDTASVTRLDLVTGCVALLKPILRMRGVLLEIDPRLWREDEAAAPARSPRWPGASSLRYLVLGSICYLQDAHPLLERIEIRPDGDDALRLVPFARPPTATSSQSDALAVDDRVPLDGAALERLADDLERTVQVDQDGVWLQLGPA